MQDRIRDHQYHCQNDARRREKDDIGDPVGFQFLYPDPFISARQDQIGCHDDHDRQAIGHVSGDRRRHHTKCVDQSVEQDMDKDRRNDILITQRCLAQLYAHEKSRYHFSKAHVSQRKQKCGSIQTERLAVFGKSRQKDTAEGILFDQRRDEYQHKYIKKVAQIGIVIAETDRGDQFGLHTHIGEQDVGHIGQSDTDRKKDDRLHEKVDEGRIEISGQLFQRDPERFAHQEKRDQSSKQNNDQIDPIVDGRIM